MKKYFINGLWKDHPALRQLLGMCSTLAVTTTVNNALFMGCGVTFVLISSCFFVSLIRKIVPDEIRIAVFTVIIATFVTIVDIFFKAVFPVASEALGPYVPLIIVNCMILGRCEAFACRNPIRASFMDALGMGIGYTWLLVALAAVRELFGFGTLLQKPIMPSAYQPLIVMVAPAGAFITLGFFVALMNRIERSREMSK
jgi:electron transport complex protein RnfE